MRRLPWLAMVVLLAACGPGNSGDDDGTGDGGNNGPDGGLNPVDPMLIAGGGVGSGEINGTLHVHVIDDATGTPISGATVTVGSSSATTSAAGLASFVDASLLGKQTISATAAGHAAATWIGANGANVTLNLASSAAPPSAKVTGTIAGWAGIPQPSSFDHYVLGLVLYTFTPDLSAPENRIAQAMNGDGTPKNACLKTIIMNGACAFELNTRTGQQVQYAIIVDGDTQGSDDTSDDTYTLIGFAASSPVTLAAGQQLTGVSLPMVTGVTTIGASLTAGPAGATEAVAFPVLDLGAPGWMVFALPGLRPGSAPVQVLANSGAFAGSYLLAGLATPPGAAATPFSSTITRGVTAGGTATPPAWLALPAIVQTGASFGYSLPAGTNVVFATIGPPAGVSAWNIMILDGSTDFTLPALSPSPLPGGSKEFALTAAEIPGFDPRAFTIPALRSGLARAAGAAQSF